MTPEEYYYDAAYEEQLILEREWQRFEEDKLNKQPAKVISIAEYDTKAKVIIIEGEK